MINKNIKITKWQKVSVFNRVEQALLKSTFDFEGAWFTSAWFDNNQLTVMGFYGKKLVGSVEMTLNRSNSQWLDASFTNIDKLVFYTNSRTRNACRL